LAVAKNVFVAVAIGFITANNAKPEVRFANWFARVYLLELPLNAPDGRPLIAGFTIRA
jgi:hypothetical protein